MSQVVCNARDGLALDATEEAPVGVGAESLHVHGEELNKCWGTRDASNIPSDSVLEFA